MTKQNFAFRMPLKDGGTKFMNLDMDLGEKHSDSLSFLAQSQKQSAHMMVRDILERAYNSWEGLQEVAKNEMRSMNLQAQKTVIDYLDSRK